MLQMLYEVHNLNTRSGEDNRHVSYLENSQDRDQALLLNEDRINAFRYSYPYQRLKKLRSILRVLRKKMRE